MQGSYKDINFKKFIGLLVAVLVFSCGCGKRAQDETVSVSIVDSVFFTTENSVGKVERGSDFSTVLQFRSGYEFVSCSYPEYQTEKVADGVLLTLKNVTCPSRVTVACDIKQPFPDGIELHCTINYDFNGGVLRGSGETRTSVDYILTQHLRPNTFNGVQVEKEGYVLVGWNTQADGNGIHIGLGSRVTVGDGESITLYAEWLKSIDGREFLFKEIAPGAVSLTGYRGKGDVQPFVIPSEIDGKEVVEIASSFTTNLPCGALSADTLVLPNTIKKVSGNSFLHSDFSELYFSDNIEEIADNAFPYQFKTYHINAFLPPCFQAVNNSILFADNVDRLILHAGEKKMIFFSGCSTAYGLVSPAVDYSFGGEYTVYNMGMNGDINGAFQLEIIINYMEDGDVLVHAPEQMSPCQLMSAFYVNSIMFIMAEGNYDLLALADFSGNTGVFRAFFDYIEIKKETEACEYADGRFGEFNNYGDYISPRPYDESTESARDVTYSDDAYCYAPELITEEGVFRLVGYYDSIWEKGGKAYFSYAPVNISARGGTELKDKGLEFAKKIEEMLLSYGYTPISDVEDYMFEGRYFYDSDYHLNDLGAVLRTEQLIKDLKAVTQSSLSDGRPPAAAE